VNKSNAPLFDELEKQMTTLPVGDLNADWVNFSNERNSGKYFDYRVLMTIRYIGVTPDLQLVSNTYTDKRKRSRTVLNMCWIETEMFRRILQATISRNRNIKPLPASSLSIHSRNLHPLRDRLIFMIQKQFTALFLSS
jgi:hypothetical protein